MAQGEIMAPNTHLKGLFLEIGSLELKLWLLKDVQLQWFAEQLSSEEVRQHHVCGLWNFNQWQQK